MRGLRAQTDDDMAALRRVRQHSRRRIRGGSGYVTAQLPRASPTSLTRRKKSPHVVKLDDAIRGAAEVVEQLRGEEQISTPHGASVAVQEERLRAGNELEDLRAQLSAMGDGAALSAAKAARKHATEVAALRGELTTAERRVAALEESAAEELRVAALGAAERREVSARQCSGLAADLAAERAASADATSSHAKLIAGFNTKLAAADETAAELREQLTRLAADLGSNAAAEALREQLRTTSESGGAAAEQVIELSAALRAERSASAQTTAALGVLEARLEACAGNAVHTAELREELRIASERGHSAAEENVELTGASCTVITFCANPSHHLACSP